jgi:hypothetical protein
MMVSAVDSLDPERDPFRPPAISTLVHCIHCHEEYESFRIEWRVEQGSDGKLHGFWCCPVPRCGGMGFGFDIFPVDPAYRNENGELMWCTDEECGEDDDSEIDASERDDCSPLDPSCDKQAGNEDDIPF